METIDAIKKIIRLIEREKKWIMLESHFLEKLKKFVSSRNEAQSRVYANACSRTLKREHRFEEKLIHLLDTLKRLDSIFVSKINQIEGQIKIYENNIISKLSNPWLGEKGTISVILDKTPLDWEQLKNEVDSAYSQGIRQMVVLLQELEKCFTEYLKNIEEYQSIKPGKGIKGDYVRLAKLIEKGSLVSNKITVEIKGNQIFRDSRPVQGCTLKGTNVEILGYHFTNKDAADIIEHDKAFLRKNKLDPYIYLLEPMDYSRMSEMQIRHLVGSGAATDVIIVKIIYPASRMWMKFEKNRPTHFAAEGDITLHNLIQRKGYYILRKKLDQL
ncbi:hypothetical protein GOV06_02825 [Candidatus Woesearchaeota archaeon]|nr:hypothetical protein [Candidatus Woesearchaeota archaeon]